MAIDPDLTATHFDVNEDRIENSKNVFNFDQTNNFNFNISLYREIDKSLSYSDKKDKLKETIGSEQ